MPSPVTSPVATRVPPGTPGNGRKDVTVPPVLSRTVTVSPAADATASDPDGVTGGPTFRVCAPVMLAFAVSVAVTTCVPGNRRLSGKTPTPLVNWTVPGSVAFGSVEVMATEPV